MIDFLEFDKIEVHFNKLSELNIKTNVYPEYYNGIVYICTNKIICDNLYLDELMGKGNDGSIYLFKEEVVVTNALIQEETDFGPTVFFLKNVKAKNMWLGGGVISFIGDVEVEQTFIGVYNHGEVLVEGELKAEVVVCDDHTMNIANRDVKYILGLEDGFQYDIADVLKSKYYDKWDECIDNEAILKAVHKGVSIVNIKPIMSQLQKRFDKMNKADIKKLDLSYLELKEIPKEVWDLKDLVSLNISGAYIDSLPPEISNLSNLQVLDISDCNFECFPKEVLTLKSLTELDISFMPFEELPEGFEELKSLKKLYMKKCKFQVVPEVLSKLPLLSHLDLSQQECDEPIIFSLELPKLKSLSLASNRGISLCRSLSNLTNLDITNCHLQEFPPRVLEMHKLSVLHMSFNYFNGLPKEFVQLNMIKDLDLDLFSINNNEIDILKQFTSLKTIRVNNRDVPSDSLERILSLVVWTKLYTSYRIENMYIGKQILERINLELIMMGEEKMDIKDQRKFLGIVI